MPLTVVRETQTYTPWMLGGFVGAILKSKVMWLVGIPSMFTFNECGAVVLVLKTPLMKVIRLLGPI